MYSENNTANDIRNRMLQNVSSNVDKSEGYFIYDALSPASKELELVYKSSDDILERTSPYTATGKDLENMTNPYGVTRKTGGKATARILVKAVIGTHLQSGTLVQTKTGLMYQTIEDTIFTSETMLVNIEALDIGSKYNIPANIITELPVQINGVISITNPDAVTNGYDVEDDESLRQRYFERLQTPATSGNKYHYRNWAKEVTGVGDAKIFPLWNGNGTVKVVIINSNKRAADNELIANVQNYIDPEPKGHGEGEAPIGATVIVTSVTEKAINVTVTLAIDTQKYTLNEMQTSIETNLSEYFKGIAFIKNYVSYASIGNIIFNTDGVIDYSNLLVNGGTSNITLQDEEIPVLGTVSLGV
ncbi:baseplate J/gp47 family protein [Clostridium sp. DJ247]|uniref:baseplate J/gp47 family protein n=1 Tax=Clostridium sp. DJ247 TaxID=2726188 RepID=UPI0016299164|nr:baseplate J/gp47 family protein [Clostridium sp. DJ247]MBC2579686.1 baseplate J/gp47 family protein [Clostridium sp. DJ247]